MKEKKEREIIEFLTSLKREEIEITASGLILISDIDMSPYEAAKILKKIADGIYRDPYFNHNIYKINLNSLLEEINNEGVGISESE